MSQQVFINQKPAIDFDDFVGSVSNGPSSNANAIKWQSPGQTYFRTRTGQKAYLVFIGNAVDPGGESKITFHVRVNGAFLRPPYDAFTQAMGETYNGWATLFARIELPQNAMIEVISDNSDGVNTYVSYARARIEYESLN